MPTVTLNKHVFEKLAGKRLSLDKLKDRISMLGTDLERIDGNEIHVEIFPNRPDMLSEQGFSRAFSSFIGVKTGLRKYAVHKTSDKVIIKDLPKEWQYAVACVIKGLKLNPEKVREIIQLQEKLGTTLTRNRKKGGLGLYPLEKITFPVTFTGKKPSEIKFRPLEFSDELTASQIISRHPKGRDYGFIMDGWEKYPVFADSKNTIMSMPPIINSHDVGKIDETTSDIFIEGTGPDLNTIKIALAILATSLADMGGKIYSLEMVYPGKTFSFPDLKPRKMKLGVAEVNKLLGLELNDSDIKKYLGRMGYDYCKGVALIPAYRADILHPRDLIEDIAIAYGYENFKEEVPNVATIGSEDKEETFIRRVSRLLTGLGLLEANTYHLGSKEEFNNKMGVELEIVELENSLTKEYSVLRNWMLPCILRILSENKHHEYPQDIFEIGAVFKKGSTTETGIYEFKRLAVACSDIVADYTYAKQILDYLLSSLGLRYSIEPTEHNSFIMGRVGRVLVKGKKIAYIGEIHPSVLNEWGIENPVVGFELNLTDLQSIIE